jgi:hypothetical protein
VIISPDVEQRGGGEPGWWRHVEANVPNQRAICTAGPNAPFQRASDPWMSFGPTGTLHAVSLVLDPDPPGGGFGDNGMVYNRSTDGGLTCGPPVTLREDTDPRFLNDKNSITADPTDERLSTRYGTGCRSRAARSRAPRMGRRTSSASASRGPIWFARSTNNGLNWEPAREIYSPPANDQTIGNQIVVQPHGTVYDFFNDTLVRPGFRALLSFITSDDQRATCDAKATRVAQMAPMDRVREDEVIDREPNVICPDPSNQGAARSGPPTSCSKLRSTRGTAISTRSGRTLASTASPTTRSRSPSR